VGDLQPSNECSGRYIIIAVIYQSRLALEYSLNQSAGVLLALFGLHLDRKKVVVVLLQFQSESVLVVKGLLHILKALERLFWESVEPVICSALETGWEHTTQEQVVVRTCLHLVLVLTEVLVESVAPK